MMDGCTGNCLVCGKCAKRDVPILDAFQTLENPITSREGYGIAVDIGTTTVVMALLELSSGKVLARHSFINPQRAFGADVISRIHAASNGHLEFLRRSVTDAVASGVRVLLNACGKPCGQADMVIAGNTAMIHFLLGRSCDSLGAFPFKPAFSPEDAYTFPAIFGESGGLTGMGAVRIVPWLAAFVGGDITAGLHHRLAERHKCFMLIDLGTNGELALWRGGELTVTSTAAGPAFEGGSHPGGASAVLGDLARLLRDGAVDEAGLLSENAPPLFTQKEIRDLQLAKSAVRTGVGILLETAGASYDAPEAVYLAGGIGQAIDADCAVDIGLLPVELRSKIRAAGNTSLGGAAMLLLNPDGMKTVRDMAASATEINLAEHPRFNEGFVEHMGF